MLTQKDKETILAASIVLSTEAGELFQTYKRLKENNWMKASQVYEKYHELNRIANELHIVISKDF